ncbi:hypothetical protein BJX64DRAFT_268310 [Aspergillus heterothallicus]
MTSPAPSSHPRPSLISPTYSQKDICSALMASTTQNPKSLEITDTQNKGSSSTAFEYPPPPPPSPVESRSPHSF